MKNIILGTVQFGLDYGINNKVGKPNKEKAFGVFDLALENNINTLDTADAYGNVLDIISEYHSFSEKRFEINTKFKNISQAVKEKRIDSDLVKLGIDYFNVVYYHSFQDYISDSHHDSLLSNAKESGLIKSVGVSVYSNDELKQVISDSLVDTIQVPYNLLDNNFQRGELFKMAKNCSKNIQVRSIFLQGLLLMDPQSLPDHLQSLSPWIKKVRYVADRHNIEIHALCLLYPFNSDYIDEIIIGVDDEHQLINNLNALSIPLPPPVKIEIDEIRLLNSSLLDPREWKK